MFFLIIFSHHFLLYIFLYSLPLIFSTFSSSSHKLCFRFVSLLSVFTLFGYFLSLYSLTFFFHYFFIQNMFLIFWNKNRNFTKHILCFIAFVIKKKQIEHKKFSKTLMVPNKLSIINEDFKSYYFIHLICILSSMNMNTLLKRIKVIYCKFFLLFYVGIFVFQGYRSFTNC